MTHLLAMLLTGGRFGQAGPRSTGNETTDPAGESFDRVLAEASGRDRPEGPAGDRPRTGEADHRREDPDRADGPGTTPSRDASTGTTAEAETGNRPVEITLLGGSRGARPSLPALTFVLPKGAGPADLAAAVRTQVLRLAATRGLEPGSLNNLRLAISSRELGSVDVELSASGNRLKVAITAGGREAENVLKRTSGELKDSILARTDRFRDVEVRVDNRTRQDEDDNREDERHGGGRSRHEERGRHEGDHEGGGQGSPHR